MRQRGFFSRSHNAALIAFHVHAITLDIRPVPHAFSASSCVEALILALARCLRLSAVCLHVVEQYRGVFPRACVFGCQQTSMNRASFIRTIGSARACMMVGLINLGYNMLRFLQLLKAVPATV
jgi:hypothetical protein